MKKPIFACTALAICVAAGAIAQTPKKKAPENATVYFLSPKDGETVSSPVTVRFGLKGMGVAPAGIDLPNTGHHHLLVDVDEPNLEGALPVTDNIRHFGAGQTETELTLPPGTHTLQLVVGDHLHIAHEKPVISSKIKITVK